MASLRQTRPFPVTTAHSIVSRRKDSCYDAPSHASDTPSSSGTLDPDEQATFENEARVRCVRKAKSQLSVKSVQFDLDRGRPGTGTVSPSRPLMIGNRGGHDFTGKIDRQVKSRRSQSVRPRDRNTQEEEGQSLTSSSAHGQSSLTQDGQYRVRYHRSRSPSHSPTVLPSSSVMNSADVDEDSWSEGSIEDSYDFKTISNVEGHRQTKFKSHGADGDDLEYLHPQKRRPKMRAPRSGTVSPGLSALAPKAVIPRPSPPATRMRSTSPLSLHSREITYRTPDPAISSRPLKRNLRLRASQADLNSPSSPSLIPTAPRTLKDVTRCLGQNRGTWQRQASSSDSEPHPDNLLDDSTSGCTSSSMSQSSHTAADPSMKMDTARRRIDIHQSAPYRSTYGLALTNESGHVIGERAVADIRSHFSSKRPTTANISARSTRTFSPQSRKSPFRSSSESLSESNVVNGQANMVRPGTEAAPTNVIRVSAPRRPDMQKSTANTSYMLPTTTGSQKQSVVAPQRRELPDRLKQDHQQQRSPRPQAASPNPMQASPSLTNHFEKSFPKTPPVSARSGIPALLRPRPSHLESSLSHLHSGSDSSSHSLPRLRKLVICNPDKVDQPSPSSSIRDKSISTTAPSQDFSILALSGSQTSVDNPVSSSDYIVPDEVAVAVASHEDQRRRQALAGLVDGLRLDQEENITVPAEDPIIPQRRPSVRRTQWNRYLDHRPDNNDDDDDDDAFFSRLSMHGDEDSLLQEPEPQAEAGFGNDEDFGFDEVSESHSDSETEDDELQQKREDENEPPLPPTPKFVHPLKDGDDLESRITRVASLHRISTSPLLSQYREQDRDSAARASLGNWDGRPSSSTWREERPHKLVNGSVAQKSSEEVSQQRQALRPFDATGTENVSSFHCLNRNTQFPSVVKGGNAFSNNPSLSSNMLTDTELPSVGDGRLSDPVVEEALSSGAEALFRQLQVEADAYQDAYLRDGTSDFHSSGRGPSPFHTEANSRNVDTTRTTEPNSLRTWRSTLPFGAFDSLAERHGASEMRRQEIIWELCETELAFVKSLRLILRLFVAPLRHEDKTWIAGIPRDVTRLFDWFDDIMHLHSQISSALHATRSAQYPVVIQVAETLRPFVAQLELHQPYLVRLESVTSAVEAMSKDILSDFGEFIRIQTASPECESMNLSSFLLKPVQRLMKYPLFFKQLWEFTPRNHPDHLATFSLLHSTDIIIRVMQEVKAREEEYELIKNLASRIKGLPSGFQLARRERRLVAQGLLRRFYLTDKECHALDSSLEVSAANSKSTLRRMTSVSSEASSFAGDWTYHPVTQTNNLASSETDHSLRADSITSDITLHSRPSMSRTTNSSRSRSSSLRGSLRHKLKESSVYAFVFTDLLILTTPLTEKLHLLRSPKNVTEPKETWKLVDDVGVSRVLGVTDQSGQLTSYDHLITVEMMSMTSKTLSTGSLSSGAPAIPVYLGIPDQKSSAADDAIQVFSEAKAKWLDAFDRCFRFTLRSLSFPSYTSNPFANAGNTDLDSDTKNSVMSILASGLPLPMSPSQQLDEAQKGRPTDLVLEEREERGWWSLRFQQVLKEMQRSSRSPVLDAGPGQSRNRRRQAEKRSATRPLLLSTNPSSTPSRKSSILSLGRKKNK